MTLLYVLARTTEMCHCTSFLVISPNSIAIIIIRLQTKLGTVSAQKRTMCCLAKVMQPVLYKTTLCIAPHLCIIVLSLIHI